MKRLFKKETGFKFAIMLVIASVVLFMMPAGMLFADTTGQQSPTTATGWTNPLNSLISDNIYTEGPSLGHTTTGFGFNIPESATINGVEVRVERKFYRPTSANAASYIADQIACLVINGVPMWEQYTIYPDYNRAVAWTQWARLSEEIKVFGGPNDTWGRVLTPADINNPNFGFNIWAMKQGVTGTKAMIDHIDMTVYYTMPAPADTTPPVIDSIADITVDATSASGAVVNFSPTATDNVDPSVTVICTPASGTTFPVGTTPVTANASDIAGNAAIPVTFNVIVNAFTPPPGGGGGTPPPAPSGISVLGIANFSNGGSITDFVTRMYRTILLREPDPEGLANWVDGITNGGLEGSDVARGFVFSEEYKEYMASLDDTGYLNFLYNRFFGRPADIDGLNGWLVNLSEGMSREDVLNYFLDCEEWNTICDSYGVTP